MVVVVFCELDDRWLLFGLWIVVGGFIAVEFVFGFGLWWVLLIILSTVSDEEDSFGDGVGVVIFGEDEPLNASFRNEPAGIFSAGSFVANCCLVFDVDVVDKDDGRCDDEDWSLVEDDDWDGTFVTSTTCFLYCVYRSNGKSAIDEETFGVECRFTDESDCEDGEITAGLAIGRITSVLTALLYNCSGI